MPVPPAARPRSQRAASGALAALLTLLPPAGLLLERGPQRPAEIAPRLLVGRTRHQHRDRGALGPLRGRADEDVEHAALGQALVERHRCLEARDVLAAAHG